MTRVQKDFIIKLIIMEYFFITLLPVFYLLARCLFNEFIIFVDWFNIWTIEHPYRFAFYISTILTIYFMKIIRPSEYYFYEKIISYWSNIYDYINDLLNEKIKKNAVTFIEDLLEPIFWFFRLKYIVICLDFIFDIYPIKQLKNKINKKLKLIENWNNNRFTFDFFENKFLMSLTKSPKWFWWFEELFIEKLGDKLKGWGFSTNINILLFYIFIFAPYCRYYKNFRMMLYKTSLDFVITWRELKKENLLNNLIYSLICHRIFLILFNLIFGIGMLYIKLMLWFINEIMQSFIIRYFFSFNFQYLFWDRIKDKVIDHIREKACGNNEGSDKILSYIYFNKNFDDLNYDPYYDSNYDPYISPYSDFIEEIEIGLSRFGWFKVNSSTSWVEVPRIFWTGQLNCNDKRLRNINNEIFDSFPFFSLKKFNYEIVKTWNDKIFYDYFMNLEESKKVAYICYFYRNCYNLISITNGEEINNQNLLLMQEYQENLSKLFFDEIYRDLNNKMFWYYDGENLDKAWCIYRK